MIRLALASLAAITACSPAATPSEAEPPQRLAHSNTLSRPAYVVDAGRMLLEEDEYRIGMRLHEFERRTRHQFAVVTVESTEGRDIADYTRDLGNRWQVGRRGHDDGIILLFSRDDRRVRIAVGDGLSRRLTDEAASEIIRTRIVPHMTAGNYAAGIAAGVDAIIARLDP